MARTPSSSASAPRNATPPAGEPGTLVRLRAAAAAVGVDEQELKRRAAAAGVKMHTVVRAGEAQAALDLDDVWRLRSDSAPMEAVDVHPSGVEVSLLATRLEKESEEHRARHAEAVERTRRLEDGMRAAEQSLRVEKSRQAQLESQLSESARTLAETQRALLELRSAHAAREREFKATLDEERKTSAGATATLEAAKLQAESALGARSHAESRLEAAASVQAELKQQLAAATRENEKLAKETNEAKALRARLSELEAALVKLNTTVSREQAEAKSARELAVAKGAEAARFEQECRRLAPFEKRLAEEQEHAKQLAGAAKEELAKELAQRDEAAARRQSAQEQKLKEAQAAANKSDAARGIFERELFGARAELEKLEETCARATLERDRFKQRTDSLVGQLSAAIEGERAIQRYADRKEKELSALREQSGKA